MTHKTVCDLCEEEIRGEYTTVKNMGGGKGFLGIFTPDQHWCAPCVKTARQIIKSRRSE